MLDQKTGEIEEDKKRALRDMMEKLADEIVQKKTALREKQLAEVTFFAKFTHHTVLYLIVDLMTSRLHPSPFKTIQYLI